MKMMKLALSLMIIFSIVSTSTYAEQSQMDIFSSEELEWLKEHPVIKVAPEDDYAPVEYYMDGEFIGLSRDYLHWISETYDIEFEFVYYETWSDILDALRNKEVDLQTSIVKTPDRVEYLSFTEPYTNMPNVVLVQKNFAEPITIETLFNYKVGIIKDYAVHEYIQLVYTPEGLFEYIDIREALTELSLGKIDALIIDLGQATYYIQEMAISNISIAEDVRINFEYKLRFATPKDQVILTSILNKALATMPKAKQQELFDKWVSFGKYSWFDRQMLNVVLGLFAFVSGLFILAIAWSMTIRKKDVKLREMNKLLEDQIDILNETQAQLIEVEKINALSRLVIGIAHEVNTPLGNGIMVSSYINEMSNKLKIVLGHEDFDVEYMKHSVDDIEYSSEKVLEYLNKTARIVDDFRSVANYQYETDSKEVVLDLELERILGIISTHQGFHCKVHLDLQPDIKVNVPTKSLFQLMTALIENSCIHGYARNEGVIEIALRKDLDYIELIVKDYGRGIPEELIEHIFEPFYTSKRGSERIGLGLYGVHNIVTHILKGHIEVISKPAEGAKFIINFPASF